MKVSLSEPVPCPPEQVRAALFREEVWTRFLDEGKAVGRSVRLDQAAGQAVVGWAKRLEGQVPGMVRKVVGDQVVIEVRLSLPPGGDGRLEIDGLGTKAKLRSALRVEPSGTGSTVHVDGDFELKGGPLNAYGRFEGQAWEEVVRPILLRDLLPQLCTPS